MLRCVSSCRRNSSRHYLYTLFKGLISGNRYMAYSYLENQSNDQKKKRFSENKSLYTFLAAKHNDKSFLRFLKNDTQSWFILQYLFEKYFRFLFLIDTENCLHSYAGWLLSRTFLTPTVGRIPRITLVPTNIIWNSNFMRGLEYLGIFHNKSGRDAVLLQMTF